MKRILLFTAVVCIGTVVGFAQMPPPAATGIGNTATSSNSNINISPSFSPDQNQASTNSRGSTSGDQMNPDFAGSSGAQTSSSTLSQGPTGRTGATSATSAGRRSQVNNATKRNNGGNVNSVPRLQQQAAESGKQKPSHNSQQQNPSQKSDQITVPLPPTEGPTTTESPGPLTGLGEDRGR